MRRPRIILVLSLLSFTGCLFSYENKQTVRGDENPRPVSFDSATGERLFAEALEKQKTSGREVSSSTIAIPFLLYWSRLNMLSEAAFFNDQVRMCDLDGNGLLSDDEVVAYHQRVTGINDPLESYKEFLEQEGDLIISSSRKIYNVRFPKSYRAAPELILSPDSANQARMEPAGDGFRLTYKDFPPPGNLHWKARGFPRVQRGEITVGFGFQTNSGQTAEDE